jgi:peptide deformylase
MKRSPRYRISRSLEAWKSIIFAARTCAVAISCAPQQENNTFPSFIYILFIMTEIIQNGHPALREVSRVVPIKEINTPRIRDIIRRMQEALSSQDDGVAIAAPQIAENVRIFVVSGKVFDDRFKRGKGIPKGEKPNHPDVIFINPEITKISKKAKFLEEGCLSVRPLYGEVKRSLNATVRAHDEHGKKFERGGGGLLAHIFQHEIDHLDGILFIDKAKDLHESTADKEFDEQA